MLGRKAWTALLNLSLLIFLAVLLGACTPVEERNVMPNPTFVGAESEIPPPGWALYQTMDANRRISVINENDTENRALLVEDFAAVSGPNGEIGLYADVPGIPGQKYRVDITFRGVAGQPTGQANIQIRFLPSGERHNLGFNPDHSELWQTVSVEGVAPSDTTTVRIYFYTSQSPTTVLAVKSIELFEVN